MSAIDDARRVAADLLREAGDEQGARVLERLDPITTALMYAATQCRCERGAAHTRRCGVASALHRLDPAWAAAEAERAHGEALATEARGESPPPPARDSAVIGIHAAAKQPDLEDVAFVRDLAVQMGRGLEVPREFVCGALVALATIDRFVTRPGDLPASQWGWWVGPKGWVLRDVRQLPTPIACRGQQGLWHPVGEVVHQTWDQLEPRQRRDGAA